MIMRRATQIAIAGVAVVTVGIGGIVFLNQKQQIAQQEQAINQQAIVARLLKGTSKNQNAA